MSKVPKEHIHVTEREPDGSWEDCTWCSGVEFVRLAYDASIPATHAEAQRLRDDAGEKPTGGSGINDLKRGIKARYNLTTPTPVSGFPVLWDKLKPGTIAVVQGSMSVFGPKNDLSRFDRNFDGGHAVCVMRLDDEPRVWWCDPEAPKGEYNGEWVTKDQLKRFVQAFPGTHLVAPIKTVDEPEEDDMPNLTKYLPGYTADIKSGSNIRADAKIAADKIRTTTSREPVTLIGTVKGDTDPANGSNVWYVWWKDGKFEYTAEDNVKNVSAPVSAGPSQSDLDKAKATIDAQAAAIAGLKTDLATAKAAADSAAGFRDALRKFIA